MREPLAEQKLRVHMTAQPYIAVCKECGNVVNLEVIVDSDCDLRITVPVCECQQEEAR